MNVMNQLIISILVKFQMIIYSIFQFHFVLFHDPNFVQLIFYKCAKATLGESAFLQDNLVLSTTRILACIYYVFCVHILN